MMSEVEATIVLRVDIDEYVAEYGMMCEWVTTKHMCMSDEHGKMREEVLYDGLDKCA